MKRKINGRKKFQCFIIPHVSVVERHTKGSNCRQLIDCVRSFLLMILLSDGERFVVEAEGNRCCRRKALSGKSKH